MNASMDDIRIYNYALNENEIQKLVEMGPDIVVPTDTTPLNVKNSPLSVSM